MPNAETLSDHGTQRSNPYSAPLYIQTARLELLRLSYDCAKLVRTLEPGSHSDADLGQTSIDFEQCN